MNERNKPVTVEDLLRLKRAERPPGEFWAQFDRELRAKQLAALVEKRPWWRSFAMPLPNWTRYHLPVGATAVLALTFFATRDYSSAPAPGIESIAAASVRQNDSAGATVSPAVEGTEAFSIAMADQVADSTLEASAPTVEAGNVVASDDARPLAGAEHGSPAARLGLLVGETVADEQISPSARQIAANFAAAREAGAHRGLLGSNLGFAMRTATVVDPLQQMTSPAEARRRARLVAMVQSSFEREERVRAAESVARVPTSERLYEKLGSRVGASGNSVTLKL